VNKVLLKYFEELAGILHEPLILINEGI